MKSSRKALVVVTACALSAVWGCGELLAAPRDQTRRGACSQTADAVLSACRAEADADYWIAVGRCDNLTDNAVKRDCNRQASQDQAETRRDCGDQFDVRQEACDKLGQAAYDPVIDPTNFAAVIDNPYFPLVPGTTFIYEGQTEAGLEHDEFAVTHNTRVILGVTCIEVHDTVLLDGVLAEDTLDWFAQDLDGNVWYFGESTHELEDGLISTIEGSFRAGIDGAKPGIIMEAHPAVGDFYRQEFDLGNAEDYAEVVSFSESVSVPAGDYENCLKTQETTPLEPDLLEFKFYAPGVGNVLTVDGNTGERVELIQITTE